MQGGVLGYVKGWRDKHRRWHPGKHAVLRFGLCEAILHPEKWTTEETALAVLVLTHESGHLRGHRWSADEAKTECWAIRHFRYVATRLGLDANKLYPHALRFHLLLPPEYWLYGCVVPSENAAAYAAP